MSDTSDGIAPRRHGPGMAPARRQRRASWRVSMITAGALAGASLSMAVGAFPAGAATTTVSFTIQGCSTWPVPAGVSSVQISAVGAAGGGGTGTSGGAGDGVSAALSGLSSGQSLRVCVDFGGGAAGSSTGFAGVAGGGGGASGVSLGTDFSLSGLVLVAGGGGGGGAGTPSGSPGNGGGAGLPAGSSGGGVGGGGGSNTTFAGGSGGQPGGGFGLQFTFAGPGTGGIGCFGLAGFGGGGGAGLFGGGGGACSSRGGGGGGGGGSDFCSADTTTVTGCTVTSGAGTQTVAGAAAGDAQVTITYATQPPCPSGTKANFRWHYTADGSAGGWSGTATQACPGSFTMGPQAMEGNLQVPPGATLKAGYDFTLPGNKNSLTMTVSAAQVTFTVSCVSGAAPSASTLTVAMPAQTYQITNDQWYPSGDQSSPLVYQGSVTVPDLCGGGKISLARGGTFNATLG